MKLHDTIKNNNIKKATIEVTATKQQQHIKQHSQHIEKKKETDKQLELNENLTSQYQQENKKQQQELPNSQLRQHRDFKQQNRCLRRLLVGNLSPNITEEDLSKDFIEISFLKRSRQWCCSTENQVLLSLILYEVLEKYLWCNRFFYLHNIYFLMKNCYNIYLIMLPSLPTTQKVSILRYLL